LGAPAENTEIVVTVTDGVATLTKVVDGYLKKSKAEEVAKGVTGVKAVVEKITVQFVNETDRSDQRIVNRS